LSACGTGTSGGFCDVSAANTPPADPNNLEYYLNSAYWPAEKRPDIEMYALQKYGYDHQGCVTHGCFLIDAMAVAYPVSHQAAVGSLAVSCASADADLSTAKACIPLGGANTLGYVESVDADGSFELSLGGCNAIPDSDSGLCLASFAASDAAMFDFIGLMPASAFDHPNGAPTSVSGGAVALPPAVRSSGSLAYGVATILTGTLLDGARAPVVGQTLELQAEGHGGWIAVHSGATSALGTVTVSVAPKATTAYRWVASGTNFQTITGRQFVVKVRVKWAPPTIHGTLKVGGVAAVSMSAWSPRGVTYKYQWYVNGKVIPRARRARLKLSSALYGGRLVVKVTGAAPGLVSATKASKRSSKIS
jgi:hypothetical protein